MNIGIRSLLSVSALRMLAVVALLMVSSGAQARLAELLSEQIADEVIDLVSNDLVATSPAEMQDGEPTPEADGPILGMPTLDQLIQGRMDVWMNPVYWSTWVQDDTPLAH